MYFKYLILGILIFSFSSGPVFAAKGLKQIFAIHHDADMGNFTQTAFFYVYNDGSYYLRTNTGDFGFCQGNGPGKYKGKLKNTLFKQMKKELKSVSKTCEKAKGCKSGMHYDKAIATWRIEDTSGKKAATYTVTGNIYPKILTTVLNNVDSLKGNPITSLKAEHLKKENKIVFRYKGEGDIKFGLEAENFMFQTKNGSILPAQDMIKIEGSVTLKIANKGQETVKYSLTDKAKKLEPTHLIHSTRGNAHHLDPENRDFFNCVKL